MSRAFHRSSWLVPLALGSSLSLAALGCGGEATTNGAAGSGGSASTSNTSSNTSSTTSATNEGGSGGAGGATTTSSGTTTTSATGGSGGGAPHTFLDKYPLNAQFPEGGTYDSVAHAFYVGSLGDGSVHKVDASTGAETVLFTETSPGTWWTLGMDVDLMKRRLWVCAMDDSQDPRTGHIWIFDLVTGKRIANHALGDAATDATCTDVAITKNGIGYVVDREVGNVYRVDPLTGATLFTSSVDLEAAIVGQNSVVVLPDQSALLSLLYLPSGLAHIDLSDGSVTPVDITGKFSDLTPLHGADGMTWDNGTVVVAFTEKLIRVTPTVADWSLATSVAVDIPNGMTDVVSTPNGLYLLNGQSLSFALGQSTDPFALVKFVGAL